MMAAVLPKWHGNGLPPRYLDGAHLPSSACARVNNFARSLRDTCPDRLLYEALIDGVVEVSAIPAIVCPICQMFLNAASFFEEHPEIVRGAVTRAIHPAATQTDPSVRPARR